MGKRDNLMEVDNLLISKWSPFSKIGKGLNLMGVDDLLINVYCFYWQCYDLFCV